MNFWVFFFSDKAHSLRGEQIRHHQMKGIDLPSCLTVRQQLKPLNEEI